MWIAIIVLSIIVSIICIRARSNQVDNAAGDYAISARKTDAIREQEILDGFMKQGYTFDEAYQKTLEECPQRGIQPCIPKHEYGYGKLTHLLNGFTSYCEEPERFDSEEVKRRREEAKRNRKPIGSSEIYREFPKDQAAYKQQLKKEAVQVTLVKKGGCLVHPLYETCQVIDYDLSPDGTSGSYVVKQLSTGKTLQIDIKDKRIRKVC